MISKNEIAAICIGLLAGLACMFGFQIITPFVEIFFMNQSGDQGPAETYTELAGNIWVISYYLLTWGMTIFVAALTTIAVAKKHHFRNSAVSGSLYYLLFLFNPEMLSANPLAYACFVVIGPICVVIPSFVIRKAT